MAAEPAVVRRLAPAKINLYLHVVGRRADGFHLLDTLFAFCGVGDVVEASPADALTLAIDGPHGSGLSAGDDNLVLRAARALAAVAGGRGARLRLTKCLPVASGLGGGSSDAAATLRALNELWRLDLADSRLATIGAALGADVPACLRGATVFAGGIGDQLDPAPPLPRCGIVLCNPGVPLSTPVVFAQRVGAFSSPARFGTTAPDAAGLAAILRDRRNDLTPGAIACVPVIAAVLQALEHEPDCRLARMSGSGATGFGVFDDAAAAGCAAERLRAAHPGWWIAATQLCDS